MLGFGSWFGVGVYGCFSQNDSELFSSVQHYSYSYTQAVRDSELHVSPIIFSDTTKCGASGSADQIAIGQF